MPIYLIIVDLFGLLLAMIGFTMAFRQDVARRLIAKTTREKLSTRQDDDDQDPLTYILRISGIMIMMFGIILAGMFTIFSLG